MADKKYDLIDQLNQLEEQGESKGGIEARLYRYLAIKARQKGAPIKGTFELTPLCNLDCKMCYVHLTAEQMRKNGCSLLTGEQWKAIAGQAVDNGLMFALLTGGEAMLHPGFEDIYLYLQGRGVSVTVNTNGLLMTEERIAFFQKNRPREIRITLYGADEETYERVTGHRVFGEVIQAIRRIKEAGLPLALSITPSRYAQSGLEALFDLVDSLGIHFSINAALSEPREGTGRERQSHDMTMDEYIRFYKRVNRIKGKEMKPVCEEDLPRPGGNETEEQKGFRCGGGRSAFSVVWNGMMQLCLSFSGIQVDVKKIPFTEAWSRINKAVDEYPVPRECIGCPYWGVCPVCVVMHAEGAPVGHANPALCERAKRLICEGLTRLN